MAEGSRCNVNSSVIVWAIWTIDIGLDRSVEELLARVAWVLGSISILIVFISSFLFPTTDVAVAFLVQATYQVLERIILPWPG